MKMRIVKEDSHITSIKSCCFCKDWRATKHATEIASRWSFRYRVSLVWVAWKIHDLGKLERAKKCPANLWSRTWLLIHFQIFRTIFACLMNLLITLRSPQKLNFHSSQNVFKFSFQFYSEHKFFIVNFLHFFTNLSFATIFLWEFLK